ncbi:MAG: type II secretion system protein [Gemmataceae bacterium]
MNQQRRSGFTLIELLTVIAIIGVLGALVTAGVFQWINSQKVRNTESTIRAVYPTLRSHWGEVVADAKKEAIPDAIMTFAGGDPDRARVIWIKTRLMEAFPVRYSEVQNAYTSAPLNMIVPASRRRYMASYQVALNGKTSPNDPATESSILLLQALSVKRAGGSLPIDNLGNAAQIKTNDGMRALIDGWGTPIRFYRFATGNTALEASKPAPGDPLDPKGTVLNPSWQTTNGANFQAWYHRFNGTSAWYSIPVLASAGKDGQFGLNAGTAAPYDDFSIDSANAGKETDNLYSYKLGATP